MNKVAILAVLATIFGSSSAFVVPSAGLAPASCLQQRRGGMVMSAQSQGARLGRIRNAIKNLIMGYDEEDRVEQESYALSMAEFTREDDSATLSRTTPQEVMDAAAAIVSGEQDALDDLVQLDISTSKSPMDEDLMASLRRRMEQGPIANTPATPPAPEAKRPPQPTGQQRKATGPQGSSRGKVGREGNTGVMERPGAADRTNGAAAKAAVPEEDVKMASAEDVERLRRMFGMSADSSEGTD
ncbi:unnamed protein product [Chrysoparadoxa australica]